MRWRKKHPKCSPAGLLSKLMDNFYVGRYGGKKYPLICATSVIYKKSTQSKQSTHRPKFAQSSSHPARVNVGISIFGNLEQTFNEKIGDFNQNRCYDIFFIHKWLLYVESKAPLFSSMFFCENLFKIIIGLYILVDFKVPVRCCLGTATIFSKVRLLLGYVLGDFYTKWPPM
jgi:hypothetical protein